MLFLILIVIILSYLFLGRKRGRDIAAVIDLTSPQRPLSKTVSPGGKNTFFWTPNGSRDQK
jgi:hypothetical protein